MGSKCFLLFIHVHVNAHTVLLYLKLRGSVWSAADSAHAVVSVGSLLQQDVRPVDLPATSQRNVTHQQQPGAIRHAGLGVFQTGAVDGKRDCVAAILVQRYQNSNNNK